jgi:hypothetical protein
LSVTGSSTGGNVGSVAVDNRVNAIPILSDRCFPDAVACDYLLVSLGRSFAVTAYWPENNVIWMARYRRTRHLHDSLDRCVHISGSLMDGFGALLNGGRGNRRAPCDGYHPYSDQ